jgi:hypothetical protein
LHRHLHRDFDRDRAGFAEEHLVEIAGQQRGQPARQRERRLVGQPAEHDMRHQHKLPLDRGADVGVVVAVAGGPPRGHAVDEFASVCEHNARPVRARDRKRRQHGLHLRVGQPDVRQARLIPGRPSRRGGRRWSLLPFHGGLL